MEKRPFITKFNSMKKELSVDLAVLGVLMELGLYYSSHSILPFVEVVQ